MTSEKKPGETAVLKLAEAMADRLRLWRKMQQQAQERGDTLVDLNVAELFEPADAAALGAFEAYVKECAGLVPLFDE